MNGSFFNLFKTRTDFSALDIKRSAAPHVGDCRRGVIIKILGGNFTGIWKCGC